MANQEQVERLKAGVEGWNKWKKENPEEDVNLRGADLQKANLEGVNLEGDYLDRANLYEANLERANLMTTSLIEANLEGANLQKADLLGASLINANLKGAQIKFGGLQMAILHEANLESAQLGVSDLSAAELNGANLMNADLFGANLQGVDLSEANLAEAKIHYSIFAETDLSKTKGLEEVKHIGPSTIDASTLNLSKGKIPEKFLRGCGLSDWEIESTKLYKPGLDPNQITDISYRIAQILIGNPIQYYSVFISYSTHDQEFAQRLHNDLQNNGVRCWFAPEDIQGGKKLYEQIDAAIRTRERLLLVLSESSMNSEWVKTEIANARQKEINEKRQVLFPISIVDFEKVREWKCFDVDTGKDSAREIREYFIPDFSNWEKEKEFEPAFKRLLEDLRK